MPSPILHRRPLLLGLAATATAATALAPRLHAAPDPLAPELDAVLDAARALDQFHALVVVGDGRTLLAEALRGPALDRPVNVKSVSKTLVAALLGAAIDRGEVPGPGATLAEVAPDLVPRGADPRVPAITLEDLVTLRAGLERTSGAGYGPWVSSRDWVAYALSRPMVAEPGGPMLYSTGSTHVLGAALARATGLSLLDQARARLGRPLGIEIPPWTRDPQGFYLGGNEMALSPLGMAAFGEMVRTGGRAPDGTPVLPASYVAASLVPRTRSPFSGLSYGYGWFLGSLGGASAAIARGYGGQVIAVVPDRGLTVAATSDPTRPARSEGYFGALMGVLDAAVRAAA